MRLIDADTLIKNLDDAIQDAKSNGEICDYWEDDRSNLLYYLDTAPSVDAVEVVRCKECKHWVCNPNTEEWGKCKWISDEQFDVVMNADDFCSYGDRARDYEGGLNERKRL